MLRQRLGGLGDDRASQLLSVVDHLVRRSIWIVGGDGWAYDIGSAGLDHVLSTGRDVNVLVLDTEVYSNTGGQASKATPLGAVAKFAAAGKRVGKKDLALQAISYGNVYVARIAMGGNPQQTLLALREAEAYPGPSLILAYSHCIAHGINMQHGLKQQNLAVHSGYWPLLRYNPEVRKSHENPFVLDFAAATHPVQGVRQQRAPLPHAVPQPSGRGRGADAPRSGRRGAEVAALRDDGDAGRRRGLATRCARPVPFRYRRRNSAHDCPAGRHDQRAEQWHPAERGGAVMRSAANRWLSIGP